MCVNQYLSFARACTIFVLLMSCCDLSDAAEHRVYGGRRAQSRTGIAASVENMGNEQVANIPYFTLRDGMSSTLTLNNLAPSPTTARVTIFNREGRAQILAPIVIDRHSDKQIQLRDVVISEDFDSGNIEVAYTGMPMALTCQVSVFSIEKRVSFESREQDMMDFMSSKLNGILWLPQPGANGFLAVTNTAMNEVSVQSRVGSRDEVFALAPRETRLLELSKEVDSQAPLAALVTLRHTGKPGDIITTGFVLGLNNGYSSSFTMFDSAMMVSRKLAGVHFRFGQPAPSEGFPQGTSFRSPLLLADVGAKPVKVRVSLDYTVEERDEDQSGSNTDTFRHLLVKELTINPANVERVELSDELSRLGIMGPVKETGLDITYDAAPGTVIGHLTSTDQTGNYSFEIPIKDPSAMNEQMEGDYPWTIENGNRAVVHFKNTTRDTVTVLLILNFPGGTVYNPPQILLRPFQSVAIDIQKLKNSNKRDVYGRAFPANGKRGQVQWRQVVPYSMIGRLEETNITQGIARSFSCGAGCCQYFYENASVSPSSFSGNVGATTTLSGWIGGRDCYNNLFGSPATPAWSSNNVNVATVDAAGNVTLVGAGTTSIIAVFATHDYFWNIDDRCHIEYNTQTVTIPITAKPAISGPNTVWWFNGLNPSGYATSITLTSSGGSATTWSVTAGANEVTLSSTSGGSITVKSSGQAFSSSAGDTKITAKANGVTSNAFSLTTRKPYRLVAGTISNSCDSTYGYSDLLNYTIQDQLLANIPADVPINENWTTSVVNDYAGTNWRRTSPGSLTTSGAGFSDHIQGEAISLPAVPRPSCAGTSTTKVEHWGQEWRVGTLTIGSGPRVQTDTLQKYIDHALHLSITSPAP